MASSSSSDPSEDEGGDQAASRKRQRKEHKRSKGKKDKDKHRDKASGGKKKSKHKKRKTDTAGSASAWGKYGLVKESQPEGAAKEAEFQAWLAEEKNVGAAALSKRELQEMWDTFREDFNTATLPHKKYYDIRKWTAKHRDDSAGAQNGADGNVAADEASLRQQRLDAARAREHEVTKDTLMRMGASNMIEDMRAQELARYQMQHAYRTGDMQTAEMLMKKLAPETLEEKWARELRKKT